MSAESSAEKRGKRNVKIRADLHRRLQLHAYVQNVKLGDLLDTYLEKALHEAERINPRIRAVAAAAVPDSEAAAKKVLKKKRQLP